MVQLRCPTESSCGRNYDRASSIRKHSSYWASASSLRSFPLRHNSIEPGGLRPLLWWHTGDTCVRGYVEQAAVSGWPRTTQCLVFIVMLLYYYQQNPIWPYCSKDTRTQRSAPALRRRGLRGMREGMGSLFTPPRGKEGGHQVKCSGGAVRQDSKFIFKMVLCGHALECWTCAPISEANENRKWEIRCQFVPKSVKSYEQYEVEPKIYNGRK